jgi:dipeptidase E
VELLLLSSSTVYGQGYLDHGMRAIVSFLGEKRRLAFVPFAIADRKGYAERFAARLLTEGVEAREVPPSHGGRAVLKDSDAVFVGGGNTFRLLKLLQESGLLGTLAERVRSGMPYLGASAGTNIAAPTIRTTNDMPIVEPSGLLALGFVPFQINPHYQDPDPLSQHMGETRDQRLREYLEENEAPVLGLREGAWLLRRGDELSLEGSGGARLFQRGRDPEDLVPGTALPFLLSGVPTPPAGTPR